jgi:hypothetical protein
MSGARAGGGCGWISNPFWQGPADQLPPQFCAPDDWLESGSRFSYTGAVLTVNRGERIFLFVHRDPIRPANQLTKPPSSHIQMKLWFGTVIFAESFLRGLASDTNVGSGMTSLLNEREGERRYNLQPSDWIPEVAVLLVSGALLALEVKPKRPGGEGTKSEPKKKAIALPVPRPSSAPDRVEAPEPDTFSNLNEDSQVRALRAAARSGAPLCEVCGQT